MKTRTVLAAAFFAASSFAHAQSTPSAPNTGGSGLGSAATTPGSLGSSSIGAPGFTTPSSIATQPQLLPGTTPPPSVLGNPPPSSASGPTSIPSTGRIPIPDTTLPGTLTTPGLSTLPGITPPTSGSAGAGSSAPARDCMPGSLSNPC